MLWAKKNSYKKFDNEKNSCGSKIPLSPPPITFLMVRPLEFNLELHLYSGDTFLGPEGVPST